MTNYFKAALRRLRERGRPEPTQSRPQLEQRAKDLLEAYAAELRGDVAKPIPRPGMWIFRQRLDHEVWVQALTELLDEAQMVGRREAGEAIADMLDEQCACRCRAHNKPACPHCLDVYGCPVHTEVSAKVLRPDYLRDPERVAEAVYRAWATGTKMPDWDALDPATKANLIQAIRANVTIRLEGLKEARPSDFGKYRGCVHGVYGILEARTLCPMCGGAQV